MNIYNIKVALRRIGRFKTHYSITAIGLFLGFAVFLLLVSYSYPFLTFDSFHRDADKIVRLNSLVHLTDQTNKYAASCFRVGPEINARYSQIENAVRIRNMAAEVTYDNLVLDEGMVLFADSSFFDVFSFNLIQGNQDQLLNDPTSLVISREMADKYFPDGAALGKTLKILLPNTEKLLTIRGIVENAPFNSSIQFDMVASMQQVEETFRMEYTSLVPGLFTFFQLNHQSHIHDLSDLLSEYVQESFPEGVKTVMELELQPFKELYFEGSYQFDLGRKGNRNTLIGLLALGILTLLIAIVNYINLIGALNIRETKNTAVRRILGSSRWGINRQHLIETSLLVSTVMALSFLAVWISLPKLLSWMNIQYELNVPFAVQLFFIFILAVSVIILASIYPIIALNNFTPVAGLKDKVRSPSGGWNIRKIMVTGQFAVTIFFLSSAWIVVDQLNYIQSKDLGFQKDQRILININNPTVNSQFEGIRQSLKSLPSVANITASTSSIHGTHTQANFALLMDSLSDEVLMNINYVDESFLQTHGVELMAGRDFSSEHTSDMQRAFIINEAAAEVFGVSLPDQAVGMVMEKTALDTINAPIIGVIANYHSQSLHQSISPMVWQIRPDAPKNVMTIHLSGPLETALTQIESAWKNLVPNQAFEYTFLDESLANQYESEQQASWFIKVVAVILLVISCSGLYSMMLFIVEEKKSEIGIRKILGANMEQLLLQLNRQNIVLMCLGFLIGLPLAIYATNIWLQQFAYRITPSWYHQLLACLLFGTMALGSVSTLTWRAAAQHPADTLRDE